MNSNFIATEPITPEEAQDIAENAIHVALRYHGDLPPDKTLGDMGMTDYGKRRLVSQVEYICGQDGRSVGLTDEDVRLYI